MNILIRQAKVISESSPHHQKIVDLLIESGIITEIKKNITARQGTRVIEADGLCISTGWVDLQAVACDPGFEHKEDLDSFVKCAASGGFTTVCVHNYNQPALHNKAQIEYVVNKTKNKVVDVLPVGTVSMEAKGKDMAEMYDMKRSGAVAFGDHKHVIQDSGMLARALQYTNNIGSFVIAHCNDNHLVQGWQMNEGEMSTSLGLKGLPALAEELMIQRSISVLEYTGGKLHVPTLSTRAGVELIKKAKAQGLNVTCGVAAASLLLDDSVLKDFDTNYKLNPPLRTRRDVQALRNGVDNGTIDAVVSDHWPQDVECKELEFDLADFGMINLQTAFSCAMEAMGDKNLDALIQALTSGPRRVLGINEPMIKEGAAANLTIFAPAVEYVFSEKMNLSRSANSPFIGKTMTGKVLGVINGSRSSFN